MTNLPRMLLAQQGSDAKVPAEDFRLALGGLLSPGPGTALACMSGVLAGTGSSGFGCDVTSPSASTLVVAAGNFVIQRVTTNGGAYIGTVDAPTTVSITGLPGTGQFKAGYIVAHAYDEAYGDSQDLAALEVVLGAAASTVAAAVYPTVPNNAVVLAGFTVTSAGVVSFTSSAVRVVARGGILPVPTGDTNIGDYAGQWRDEPQLGLQRWSGSTWYRPHVGYWGSGTSFPASPQFGDTFQHTGVGCLMRYGSNGWRQAEEVPVGNAAARTALSTAWPAVLHPGFRVWQSDIASDVVWTGSVWRKEPGQKTLIYSLDGTSMPGSGSLAPGGSSGILNAIGPVPAHTPGPLEIQITTEVVVAGNSGNTAGQLYLGIANVPSAPTAFTPQKRFHTEGTGIQVFSMDLTGYWNSDGGVKYLWVLGTNDSGSSWSYNCQQGSLAVWQL